MRRKDDRMGMKNPVNRQDQHRRDESVGDIMNGQAAELKGKAIETKGGSRSEKKIKMTEEAEETGRNRN